jgi:Ca-activated chloride channel family protein
MEWEVRVNRIIKLTWWAMAALTLMPGMVSGQKGRAEVNEGNRLYSEGRFSEAHQKYLEALLQNPESPLIRFNDGNALYQEEDFQKAMERFLEATESGDPALSGSSWYNLGNALFRQQQLQESLEAYKQALRTNPADLDAKHNLERVLEQLQEQEQQDQEGGDESQDQNQDQDQSQGQNQQQDEQDQEQEQEQQQENDEEQEDQNPQENQDQSGDQQPDSEGQQPQPGEMTPEEAERLLNAIREDPGDVNRKRAAGTGKRPRKKW